MAYGGGGGGAGGGSGSGGAAGGTAGGQGGSRAFKVSFMGDRALLMGGVPAVDTISYFDINTGGAAVDYSAETSVNHFGYAHVSNGSRAVAMGNSWSGSSADTME